jgi:hypothetical protein
MRLGKIEKYVLVWAYTYHNEAYMYVSKSGALLSYARHKLGYASNPRPASVRPVLPKRLYNSLHVSFSRALRSLAELGLLTITRQRGDIRGYGMSLRGGMTGRRQVFFNLTEEGRRAASRLISEEGRLDT